MLEKIAGLAAIMMAVIALSDRAKVVKRARKNWNKLYYWYNREQIPTECGLCHKKGKRRSRFHSPLSEWEAVSGWGWEYYLARGRKVVRGATGRRYGLIPPFRAEIEHFSCKALRWIIRRISDSGAAANLSK